jgi:preprotein translocase subunit YajC
MMTTFLLQAQTGSSWSTLVMFGLIFVVFYFFMIRPQQKREKENKKFIEELKAGQHVVTIGGIHGKVVELHEKTLILESESGAKFKVERSAVSREFSLMLEK